MKMKRYFIALAASLLAVTSLAQTTADDYKTRYALLVNKLGTTGVGIETLIGRWEADFPDDVDMLCAKFNYYYEKCQSSKIVSKDQPKFIGMEPVLSLNDSTGKKVNYFEERFFEDEMYGKATAALDKAIKLNPNDIELRFSKITSLMAYEKESPDMATQAIRSLIDYNYSSHPLWIFNDVPFLDDSFSAAMVEYCYVFFKTGTPSAMEAFRSISEKMAVYDSKNPEFLNNLGSYYLAFKKDSKTALKYYNKALKVDPDNYSAVKNCVLLARKDKNVKLEKKYLQKLAVIGATDNEKAAAKARLESLK